jgi:hypothetical protein
MAKLQPGTIEERILYWLSLDMQVRALAERLLERFAVTVGDLPASAADHHAEPGGPCSPPTREIGTNGTKGISICSFCSIRSEAVIPESNFPAKPDEFVGRKPQLEAFRQALRQGIVTGRAPSFAVLGEWGIGKSSLLSKCSAICYQRFFALDKKCVSQVGLKEWVTKSFDGWLQNRGT